MIEQKLKVFQKLKIDTEFLTVPIRLYESKYAQRGKGPREVLDPCKLC